MRVGSAAGAVLLLISANTWADASGGVPGSVEAATATAASTTTETIPYNATITYPAGVTLLYSGSRGGKLEPCGCRALNLGGIDREMAMVEAVRSANPATLYVDAGGFFREFPDQNLRLESWHLLDALSAGGIDAMNVSFAELREGVDGLQRLARDKNLPFISANIVDAASGKPLFPPHQRKLLTLKDGRKVRIAIVGATSPNSTASRPQGSQDPVNVSSGDTVPCKSEALRSRWTIAPIHIRHANPSTAKRRAIQEQGGAGDVAMGGGHNPAIEFALTTSPLSSARYHVTDEVDALRPIVQQLRAETDVLVLLSFASVERTEQIVLEVPGFDVAVAGDFLKRHEVREVGARPTRIVAPDREGKYLGQVDLRIGDQLAVAEASVALHPILQSVKPLERFSEFGAAYRKNTMDLPVPATQQIAQKLYAGATSCRACHAEAFTQWRTHHHSRAMKALVDKQMHYNPDCLRCHTVAFRQPGGFTDLRVTPHLSNVQCEVCHGPGQQHVEFHRAAATLKQEGQGISSSSPPEPMRMEWDASFCMQCHDPQNDPHFNFEQDIQRVRHKNPAAPRERPTTASLMM